MLSIYRQPEVIAKVKRGGGISESLNPTLFGGYIRILIVIGNWSQSHLRTVKTCTFRKDIWLNVINIIIYFKERFGVRDIWLNVINIIINF